MWERFSSSRTQPTGGRDSCLQDHKTQLFHFQVKVYLRWQTEVFMKLSTLTFMHLLDAFILHSRYTQHYHTHFFSVHNWNLYRYICNWLAIVIEQICQWMNPLHSQMNSNDAETLSVLVRPGSAVYPALVKQLSCTVFTKSQYRSVS